VGRVTQRLAITAWALSSLAACAGEAAPPALDVCALERRTADAPMPAVATATPAQAATTYYVRTDGGDASQCTGRSDAAYPGSGTAQACAWKNPNIALPPSGSARIAGGDTLLIGAGTYQIGNGGYMQAVPSGTTTARTRILGKAGAKLAGVAGTHRVLNLEGSSNVEIGNLEITDLSDCVYNHSNSTATCVAGGPWARGGIYASASRNVWLHDLNIHGLAARGIQAGGLADWTVERVKILRNGTAGWTGDIGTGSSNSGKITLRNIEIGWNGCGERVATGEAWACWGQQTGGYGDGLGTAATGGQWLIEDAFIHHNTSDGLDLLYMDGADTSSVTVRRLYSVANAGNQVKVSGNSLIENSVIVGYCTFYKGKYFMVDGDYCRAYGATLLLNLSGNDTAIVRHNTLAGEGDNQITYNNGNSTDRIYIQNNVAVGFPYFATGALRSFSSGSAPAAKTFSGNLVWHAASCPSGATCTQDPKLANMTLPGFDAEPLAGSPAIDKAPMISAVATDFLMQPRPVGAANDIGAYEVQPAGTVTPSTRVEYDFNGDGKSDVLWRNKRTGANAIWNSGNQATAQVLKGVTDLAWKIVGTGDFNGDGRADVLWRNNRTGADVIWKSGNYDTQQAMTAVTNPAWQIVGTGDFDGDGKSDVLWRNSSNGHNAIWKSARSGTPQTIRRVTDTTWHIAGTGDFNGDGRSDVLWHNSRTGANVIWNSGNYGTQQAMTRVTNLAWQIVATGDFNGDGRSDVLWRNTGTGADVIWKSASASSPQSMAGVPDLAWTVEP
jgi:hypothetical protein